MCEKALCSYAHSDEHSLLIVTPDHKSMLTVTYAHISTEETTFSLRKECTTEIIPVGTWMM